MSKGQGARQQFLTELLKQINGFFLNDICETRTDEQAFARAIRTAKIPARRVSGFKSQWVGDSAPPFVPTSQVGKGENKRWSGWRKNIWCKLSKENIAKREDYEERLYQAVHFLSVNGNVITSGHVCRHLEAKREWKRKFYEGAAKFFQSREAAL